MERFRIYLIKQRGPAIFLLVLITLFGIFFLLGSQADLWASYKFWRQKDREITLDDIARDGIKKYYFNQIYFAGTTDYEEHYLEGDDSSGTFVTESYYYYVFGDQGYVVMICTRGHPAKKGYERAYWEGIVRRTPPDIRKWAKEDREYLEANGYRFEPGYYIDLDSTPPSSEIFFSGLRHFGIWAAIVLFLLVPFMVRDTRTHYYE